MTNEELSFLLDVFTAQHPHLKDLVCADQGIRLMNVDARIAERVHQHFTAKGVPILSVHDSFIIDYTRVGEMKQVMGEASKAVTGLKLAVSASGIGLDEMQAEARADFVSWVQAPRSSGYLRRLKDWEGRVGREVVPYG